MVNLFMPKLFFTQAIHGFSFQSFFLHLFIKGFEKPLIVFAPVALLLLLLLLLLLFFKQP